MLNFKEKRDAQRARTRDELLADAIRGNATLQANPELQAQTLAGLANPMETAK